MRVTATIISVGFVAWCYSFLRTHQAFYDAETFRNRYGDWAIIAGASEGLGAAWADSLCEYGINVLLLARRENALKEVARDLLSSSSSSLSSAAAVGQKVDDQQQPQPRCRVDTLVQDLGSPNVDDVIKRVLSDRTRRYDSSFTTQRKTVTETL